MRSIRLNPALSLHASVTKAGAVTGATVRVGLKRNDVANAWLDFGASPKVFLTSGWSGGGSGQFQALTEAGDFDGFYEYILDMSSDFTLPAATDSVIPVFEITAPDESVAVWAGEEIFFDEIMRGTDSANTVIPMLGTLSQTEHDATQTAIGAIPAAPSAAVVSDAVWDEILTGGTHNISNSAGKRLRQLLESTTASEGTVVDAGATASQFDTNLTEVDAFWNDTILIFIDGALAGQARTVQAYLNASGNLTFDEVWTSVPANGTSFLLLATHVHPVTQIAAAVWDELRSGHVDAGSFGELLQFLSTDNLETQLFYADGAISGSRTVPDGAVSHAGIEVKNDADSFIGTATWYVWYSYASGGDADSAPGSSTAAAAAPTDGSFTTVAIPS